jgi:hypothetical protein
MEIILLTIIIVSQFTYFLTLKNKIMGAQAVTEAMIAQVIAIVTEAFNTNVGDLTEAEAEAKKAEFIASINAIINPA